jgi:arylsulfatase A-like enzyme
MTKPNILFILIDSMRADKFFLNKKHLQFKKLIDQGVYFEQNISPSDYTVTGIGSIFTGCYPFDAGLKAQSYQKLYSNNSNYVEFLKQNGYHAYTTMAESVAELGFSKLFDNVDQTYPNSLRLFDGLGEKIINFLKSKTLEKPWFYFIHLEDLHLPVSLPSKYEHVKYSERYDIAISEIHSWINKIIQLVDLKNTLVVITSDHGDYIPSIDDSKNSNQNILRTKSVLRDKIPSKIYDKLSSTKRSFATNIQKFKTTSKYEKRAIETRTGKNRYLYDEIIRTPLLFFGYDIKPNKIVKQQVRSIDIFPTLVDIIGIEKINFSVHGQSLKPLLKNKTISEFPVYLESTVFATIQKNAIPHLGIRTPQFKYFRRVDNPKESIHLYDLVNDPFEENNIFSKNQNIVFKMEEEILKIKKNNSMPVLEDLDDSETKKVEDELRKLGYI